MHTFGHVRHAIKAIPVEFGLFFGVLWFWFGVMWLLVWVGFTDSGNFEHYRGLVTPFLQLNALSVVLVALSVAARWMARQKDLNGVLRWHRITLRWSSYALLMYTLMNGFAFFVVTTFLSTNTEYTAAMSLKYLAMDAKLYSSETFAAAIRFSEAHPFLLSIVQTAYDYTVAVIVVAIFVLALFSARVAREYTLALLLSVFVCMPFWIVFPAIAPYQLSLTDSFFETSYQERIRTETKDIVDLQNRFSDTVWNQKSREWSYYWESIHARGYGFPISCNPSMHVMWGVLMVIYFFRAHRLLGVLGVVYVAFETVGTVFFLQHYVIDIFTALIGAFLIPYLVAVLLRFEKKKLSVDESDWFAPLQWLERATRWVLNDIRSQG